jgi:trigger factor
VKVTTEHTANCEAIVTVEVDEEQMSRAMRTAAQRISRIRPVPGFRPGKAPYERVERMVGKDLLRDEAIDELAQSLYKQVIKDEKIAVYDAGKLDVVQKDPAILKFTIPTRPVVTLGDYRSIHMQPKPVEVSDAEVNQVIERLQRDHAEMTPVTRSVQSDDLVTINVKGGVEGQTLIDREGLQVRIEKEKGIFPWLDQVIGANLNEPHPITHTYPADHANKDLAGKAATYTVTVTDIKETHLFALDDEFAKSVSSFETLDQLKGRIRANLQAEMQIKENNRFTDEVVDAVVAQSQIAYPASMLDDEIDIELAQAKENVQRLGLAWDKYLQLAGKSESEYREESRPRAEQRLKRLLTLMELAEAEKLEAASKEVDVEIDMRAGLAARSGGRADQTRRSLSTPDSRENIKFNLRMRKAIDFLVASAEGEPTSGKIVTPAIVREEMRARELAAQAAQAAPPPGELITDPAQVRPEDWPRGLDRPLVSGQDQ